jgi:hypothetical protein
MPKPNAIPLEQWHPSPIPVYIADKNSGVFQDPERNVYGVVQHGAVRREYHNAESAKSYWLHIAPAWQHREADHNTMLVKLARWQGKTFEQVKAEQRAKQREKAERERQEMIARVRANAAEFGAIGKAIGLLVDDEDLPEYGTPDWGVYYDDNRERYYIVEYYSVIAEHRGLEAALEDFESREKR